ncbi:antitoxin HipB [Variibacter gotjawalensis]|uniref:Antitoxin HipB n=1 Tax=Variibacter gotjawalensis TaxID=1333996 RepID=A0A0S3PRW1_9BRAD|nr:helix-turn-helix transcriptional regulator [Variibacter gotjawalensis]NIK48943.1 ribosome-binding protein aMBF1 (putative translation factor) [Variibacter gotjawalensis]RZS50799.1 helix-turn-helix protein [Variibacter gotjawalensis]BAT58633.1 antitoxin HipB [Variibacter gotjawalensis]
MTLANVQIIRAPNGDEMVVLPKAQFDALASLAAEAAEDAADVAAYDAAKLDLEAGRAAKLPADLSLLITRERGAVLRAIRKWRGLTQEELSEKVGIAQGYLSALEQRHRNGTEETIRKLADALDIPFDWLRA